MRVSREFLSAHLTTIANLYMRSCRRRSLFKGGYHGPLTKNRKNTLIFHNARGRKARHDCKSCISAHPPDEALF